MTTGDGRLWLVALEGTPHAMHLTHQATLDRLGLDDRISTGRVDRLHDPLLATCHALSDALHDWWDGETPPIVYRTRSMPSSRTIAFGPHVPLVPVLARPLHQATSLLAQLVMRHGFDVPPHWL